MSYAPIYRGDDKPHILAQSSTYLEDFHTIPHYRDGTFTEKGAGTIVAKPKLSVEIIVQILHNCEICTIVRLGIP